MSCERGEKLSRSELLPLIQSFKPFSYYRLQRCFLRFHVSHIEEQSQPSSVCVIACQESGFVRYTGPARKHETDAVVAVQVEDHDVSFVLLGVEWLHFSAVEERRRVPLDLFANLAVCTQNDSAQSFNIIGERMLESLHVGIDLLGLRGFR